MGTPKHEWMDRILAECRRQGISDADLARRLNVKRQTVSSWKKRGIPLEQLDHAARSIGISTEYIKTGLDVARFHHQLREDERRVIAAIRELDPADYEPLLQPLLELADKVRRYRDRDR